MTRVARRSLCGRSGGRTPGRARRPPPARPLARLPPAPREGPLPPAEHGGGSPAPTRLRLSSTPAFFFFSFLSRCKTQNQSKGKKKSFDSSDVFSREPPTRETKASGLHRPAAAGVAWLSALPLARGVFCSKPSGFTAAKLPLVPRHCGNRPLVSPIRQPGSGGRATDPCARAEGSLGGRLSSLIASEAAGGDAGCPPREPPYPSAVLSGAGDRWHGVGRFVLSVRAARGPGRAGPGRAVS